MSAPTLAGPRLPHVHVPLVGQDANSFVIVSRALAAMRAAKVPQEQMDAFEAEATSGDHHRVIATAMAWVNVGSRPMVAGGPAPARGAESATVPAGTYRIGDPCYSVPQDRWLEWLEAAGNEKGRRCLLAEIDGRPVLGIGTQYGDGEYFDQHGRAYGVDAGLIGLVPVDLPGIDRDRTDEAAARSGLYHVVELAEPALCWYDEDDGTIVLGEVRIHTGDEPEDEDDWDDWELDDDEDRG